MTTRAKAPRSDGLPRDVGHKWAGTRPSRMEAEEQCLFLQEALASHGDTHPESTWVIDLSEYVDGVTLALAGGLAGFRELARLRGCEVRYTGLMSGFTGAQLESG